MKQGLLPTPRAELSSESRRGSSVAADRDSDSAIRLMGTGDRGDTTSQFDNSTARTGSLTELAGRGSELSETQAGLRMDSIDDDDWDTTEPAATDSPKLTPSFAPAVVAQDVAAPNEGVTRPLPTSGTAPKPSTPPAAKSPSQAPGRFSSPLGLSSPVANKPPTIPPAPAVPDAASKAAPATVAPKSSSGTVSKVQLAAEAFQRRTGAKPTPSNAPKPIVAAAMSSVAATTKSEASNAPKPIVAAATSSVGTSDVVSTAPAVIISPVVELGGKLEDTAEPIGAASGLDEQPPPLPPDAFGSAGEDVPPPLPPEVTGEAVFEPVAVAPVVIIAEAPADAQSPTPPEVGAAVPPASSADGSPVHEVTAPLPAPSLKPTETNVSATAITAATPVPQSSEPFVAPKTPSLAAPVVQEPSAFVPSIIVAEEKPAVASKDEKLPSIIIAEEKPAVASKDEKLPSVIIADEAKAEVAIQPAQEAKPDVKPSIESAPEPSKEVGEGGRPSATTPVAAEAPKDASQKAAARARQESSLSLDTAYAVEFFSSAPPPVHVETPIEQEILRDLHPARTPQQVARQQYLRRVVLWVMLVTVVFVAIVVYVLWQRGLLRLGL